METYSDEIDTRVHTHNPLRIRVVITKENTELLWSYESQPLGVAGCYYGTEYQCDLLEELLRQHCTETMCIVVTTIN